MKNELFTTSEIKIWQQAGGSATAIAGENLKADLTKVFDKACVSAEKATADILLLEFEQLKQDPTLWEAAFGEALLKQDGSPEWEAFLIQELEGKLIVAGSDTRGLIYGIYELSQMAGVSPWHFFADVPAKSKKFLTLPQGFRKVDHPSVQYRGIFINDEEELNHWAQAHTEDGTIGPTTYRRVFDLLLRLKANYIWPAMHVNFFNNDPENGRLANEMGIVVGTSHCDMLLRSNQHEWQPWLKSQGYADGEIEYDFSIPGKNREALVDYWTGSVEMNKDYQVSYTVGMRGIHDSGFITKEIDGNPMLSKEERAVRKKELLEEVIAVQRHILADTLQMAPENVLQTFVPYKEVLAYYDDGLAVPDDVTIIWANDNYGNIRRFPEGAELKRAGGHGLYYHSSYWAPHNMHYLFINSTPLAKMKNELQKAWDNGIQKMWVLNVGAIKPIEQDLEFYTRFAWEVGKESTTADILAFLTGWMDREFSGEIGAQAADLLNRFTQAVNVRKIEMMDPNTFSQVGYGDEAARRLHLLKELYDQANSLAEKVLPAEKEAFFQLVQMKIHAAYYKNAEFYFADRSCLAAEQGKLQAADRYREASAEYTELMRWLIHYYNKVMADGKWDRILTPELAPPPNMKMYPPTKPALKIDQAGLNAVCWQGASKADSISFTAGSGQVKWLEVFNTGAGLCSYKIEAPDWLKLSKTEGEVATEERVLLELAESLPENEEAGVIRVSDASDVIRQFSVSFTPAQKSEEQAWERDGAVSIPLAKFSGQKNDTTDFCWQLRPYQGRYEGAAIETSAPVMTALPTSTVTENPQVFYQFELATGGSHLLELYRQPSLNAVGEIRLGISIDDGPVAMLSSTVTDEHTGNWETAILDDTDKLYLNLPYLERGSHKLNLHMIDSYVCLTKAVIYTSGFCKTSLGPLYSDQAFDFDAEKLPPFSKNFSAVCEQIYCSPQSDVENPVILFADEYFYSQDFIGADLVRKEQAILGEKTYFTREDGTKDIINDYLKNQPLLSSNGTIAIEAEQALAQDQNAYLTAAHPDAATGTWEPIGSTTADGTGIAMTIRDQQEGTLWPDPRKAPGMHYSIEVAEAGDYAVWFFLKYDNRGADKLALAVDDELFDPAEYTNRRGLFSYLSLSIWHWNQLTTLHLEAGRHVLSIYGVSANVAVDRIFMTKQAELPPIDAEWPVKANVSE